jgi:hypothetical protein
MGDLEADYNLASLPLELNVVNITAGGSGITGLTCTVAVRMGGTTTDYLDWNDNTFKNAGWVVKNQPMADLGTGVYEVDLPVQALGFTPLTGLPVELVAEYSQSDGTGVGAIDYITVSELRPDAKLSRQYNTNRLDALAPGQLTLYEDDAVTVQSVQTLTDATGGPTVDAPGAPQKRGPAPP